MCELNGVDIIFKDLFHLYKNVIQKALSNHGIYFGQHFILLLLKDNGGMSQKELADSLNIKPSTINVVLKRMEKSGLLRREPDKEDMRRTHIYLTQKGEDSYYECVRITKQIREKCFWGFTDTEKRDAYHYCGRIIENLTRLKEVR